MQIRKLLATGLAALMAGSTLAMPALAATQLKDFPTFLGKDGQLDAFVVVGASAATSDVVGAVDLAVRLAETSYTTVATTATSGVTGLERDGISIGTADGGAALSTGGTDYNNPFPSGALLKNFHFSGLKDSTFSWKSTNYDFSEQVDLSGVRMRHDWSTSNVNGTEKMEIQSGDVIYEYVFDKAINLSTATTAGTTGTIASPEYSSPINIELMGKKFTVVGIGSNQAKMLAGSIGTATATSGVTYGDYTIYSDQGSNNAWARIIVQDKDGNTKDTLIIDDPDATSAVSSKDSSATSLTIKVTAVRALQDGTVIGVDVVIGPTGTVEKTYDTTADTTSTGTASDKFPGETAPWGIRIASGDFGTPGGGYIAATDKIQIIYQPTSTEYLKAGEKLVLPNSYAELAFDGFGTDKFATVTVEPVTSVSAYNSTGDVVGSNLNGIKISSDVAGSIVGLANNGYDTGYFLMAPTVGGNASYPVYVGFWDNANTRIKTNDTATNSSTITFTAEAEVQWRYLRSWDSFTYPFKLSYAGSGEKNDFLLNITLVPNQNNGTISDVRVGDPGNFNVNMSIQNKTGWTSTAAPEFRLGGTAASAEASEVRVVTEGGSVEQIGTTTQDVVDDTGLQVLSANTYGASDKVKIKVPSKELTVKASFGKKGVATAAGAVKQIASVTSAVAKLDTEVGAAEKAKNLVLVGGPCVNKITAEALNVTYPACGAASTIPENAAIIKAVDGAFTTGKVALVVAGWRAEDTRLATSVLQQKASSLVGSASKVSGTAVSTATITAA